MYVAQAEAARCHLHIELEPWYAVPNRHDLDHIVGIWVNFPSDGASRGKTVDFYEVPEDDDYESNRDSRLTFK